RVELLAKLVELSRGAGRVQDLHLHDVGDADLVTHDLGCEPRADGSEVPSAPNRCVCELNHASGPWIRRAGRVRPRELSAGGTPPRAQASTRSCRAPAAEVGA